MIVLIYDRLSLICRYLNFSQSLSFRDNKIGNVECHLIYGYIVILNKVVLRLCIFFSFLNFGH